MKMATEECVLKLVSLSFSAAEGGAELAKSSSFRLWGGDLACSSFQQCWLEGEEVCWPGGETAVRWRRLGRSTVAVLGPLASNSRRAGVVVSTAGGRTPRRGIACGVARKEVASQGACWAARPQQTTLWENA